MPDLPRDHLVRTSRRLAPGVRQFEHAHGIADRAKRRAQTEHKLERERARRRFAVLLFLLLLAAVLISLTIWDQIQALFGL